jgi:hypothetical protein
MTPVRSLRLYLCLGLVACLALVAVGCGESDDGDASGATITKAQFIKKADETCAKAEARQLALVGKFSEQGRPPSKANEEALIRFAAVPPLNAEAEELSALPLPSEGSAQAEAFLRAFEAGIEGAEAAPGRLLERARNPFAKAEALAAQFGLKVCGGA